MSNKWAEDVFIGRNHVSLELRFSADATVSHFTAKQLNQLTTSAQAESLRSSLQILEGLMKGYKPLMSKTMERTLGKGIQLGAVFAEVCSAHTETSRTLTPLSSIQSQRLS